MKLLRLFLFVTFFLSSCTFLPQGPITEPIEFNQLFSITPTAYPLPRKVYDQQSKITMLLKQIFSNKNKYINPYEIIQNAQKEFNNNLIDLYVQNNLLEIDSQFWEMEFIKVYDYVSNRLNLTIDEKVTVIFVPPQEGNCAPRGVTIHEQQPVNEASPQQAAGYLIASPFFL